MHYLVCYTVFWLIKGSCAQNDVPEAVRKKARSAPGEGSALQSRATSQDAPQAAEAAEEAPTASGQQPASASAPGVEIAAAASAPEAAAAAAEAEAQPDQAAEPMQVDSVEPAGAPPGQDAPAASEQAAASQPGADVPAATNGVAALESQGTVAKTAVSDGKREIDGKDRDGSLGDSRAAISSSKQVPSVNGKSVHEGSDTQQSTEQANGRSSSLPPLQAAKQSKGDSFSHAENGASVEEGAAAPAKHSRPAVKRAKKS